MSGDGCGGGATGYGGELGEVGEVVEASGCSSAPFIGGRGDGGEGGAVAWASRTSLSTWSGPASRISCNFFSGSRSPKNSEVKRAWLGSEKFGDG